MLNRKNAQIAIILLVTTAICHAAGQAGQSVNVIPQPVSMEVKDGYFEIGPETRIVAEKEAAAEAAKLLDALAPAMGFRLSMADASQRRRGSISLRLD